LLEFEHIVQVNDLSNTTITSLTRHQLWEGLLLRARHPDKFNQSLQCRTEPVSENEFTRYIQAGQALFCEHVTLSLGKKICTKTIGDESFMDAESTASIEEPEKGALFVRFSYRRQPEPHDSQIDVGEHLKSAYVQIDRDAIAMIRVLAESDMFDQMVN
jgi:hypothetical protein